MYSGFRQHSITKHRSSLGRMSQQTHTADKMIANHHGTVANSMVTKLFTMNDILHIFYAAFEGSVAMRGAS